MSNLDTTPESNYSFSFSDELKGILLQHGWKSFEDFAATLENRLKERGVEGGVVHGVKGVPTESPDKVSFPIVSINAETGMAVVVLGKQDYFLVMTPNDMKGWIDSAGERYRWSWLDTETPRDLTRGFRASLRVNLNLDDEPSISGGEEKEKE